MITRFTMTGADNSIRPEELIILSKEYPFVEWGILVSKNSMGSRRFPSLDWLKALEAIKTVYGNDFKLSCHLCGRWVRDILQGNMDFIDYITPEVWAIFDRVQINTHAEPHEHSLRAFMVLGTLYQEKEFIFQYDNVNTAFIDSAKQTTMNFSALFDLSHGIGILPEFWPDLLDGVKCGYAGGLSPENLEDQIKRIEEKAGDTEIWIDMETHIRSNNDMLFDLQKVRQCLDIAVKTCPQLINNGNL
jgi:hypothetical protein